MSEHTLFDLRPDVEAEIAQSERLRNPARTKILIVWNDDGLMTVHCNDPDAEVSFVDEQLDPELKPKRRGGWLVYDNEMYSEAEEV